MTRERQDKASMTYNRLRIADSTCCGLAHRVFGPRDFFAFTLVELLIVIAVIGILASLLLPALSKAAGRAKSVCCENNLKQLQIAWLNYAHDNNDALAPNIARNIGGVRQEMPGSWVCGSAPGDTNITMIKAGVLFPYLSPGVYRCPSDQSTVANHPDVPRTRSYSMCFWMNGDTDPTPSDEGWENGSKYPEVKSKLTRIAGRVFVFIDENEQSIDDGIILVGHWFNYRWVPDVWYGLPSDRHNQGCSLSFSDGHAERWRWSCPKRFLGPGQHVTYASQDPQQNDLSDLRKLQACLPMTP
jgi:prepilin-type N-terminal cleavage/methylation domain-containing protein